MTDRNRRMTWTGTLLAAVLVAGGGSALAGEATSAATAPASQPASAPTDWPQWRGPNRDGVAPSSPKLLDKWPAGGLPLLWKSEQITGGADGGMGSVVVAGGR